MKKLKKLIAAVIASVISAAAVMPIMPVSAAVEEKYLLDLDFDSQNDAENVIGLIPEKVWVSYSESQLSYIQDGSEYVVRFPLSEKIDLSSNDKYEIRLRFKMPHENYRLLALSNGNPEDTLLYPAMAQGFLALCRYSFPATGESDMSLDDKSGIGSASSNEWRTTTITYNKGNISLKVEDEKASGTVTNTTSTTLASLTGNGNFQHRPGTKYDHLLWGSLARDQKLSLDYIKVKKISDASAVSKNLGKFEFDGNDDTTKISGLAPGYVWVRDVSSQLAMLYNPTEVPVELELSEPIDLSTNNVYEIEMRAKIPTANYRYLALKDNDVVFSPAIIYHAYINNFVIGWHDGTAESGGTQTRISSTGTKTSVGAADNEWRTLKYTINRDKITLKMTVEGANGERMAQISEDMSAVTGTAGSGVHVSGRTYEKIMFGNLAGGTEYTVDYVKVTKHLPVAEMKVSEITKGETKIDKLTQLAKGDNVRVFLDCKNYTGEAKNYAVIAAVYGTGNNLISADVIGAGIAAAYTGAEKSCEYTIGDMNGVKEIKFFVWSNLKDLEARGSAYILGNE